MIRCGGARMTWAIEGRAEAEQAAMPERFEKEPAHYDPIHRGYTPRGIANGVTATGGWCFPRVLSGGYNLYRGPSAASIDFSRPVGAAGR